MFEPDASPQEPPVLVTRKGTHGDVHDRKTALLIVDMRSRVKAEDTQNARQTNAPYKFDFNSIMRELLSIPNSDSHLRSVIFSVPSVRNS